VQFPVHCYDLADRDSVGVYPSLTTGLSMNVTMTWGDIAVVTILGFVPIVAIAFVVRLPRMTAAVLLWWAERTAASRTAKLQKLKRELADHEALFADPVRFTATALLLLGRVVIAGLGAVIGLSAGALVFVVHLQQKLAPLSPQGVPFLSPSLVILSPPLDTVEGQVTLDGVLALVSVLVVLLSFAADRFLNFVGHETSLRRLQSAIRRLEDRQSKSS
jgi:hypothetical protein